MQRLLIDPAGSGYPPDYLMSRLQGRRALLAEKEIAVRTEGLPAVGEDNRYWLEAATERVWLFRQLSTALRATLAPLFVYFEMGTIALVLRYLAGERSDDAGLALQSSMLSPSVRAVFTRGDGVSTVLARLERSPMAAVLPLAGVAEIYDKGGLRLCEEVVRGRFLQRTTVVVRHEDLSRFFRWTSDIRTMLGLAKHLRWETEPPQDLFAGGPLPGPRSVERLSAERLFRMVRRWTNGRSKPGGQVNPAALEALLHDHLLRLLKLQRQKGGVVAASIEYVWRCYAAARAQSVLVHRGPGR